jgi:hypothetical protein
MTPEAKFSDLKIHCLKFEDLSEFFSSPLACCFMPLSTLDVVFHPSLVNYHSRSLISQMRHCQWSKGLEGAPPTVVSRSGGGAAAGGIANGRGAASRRDLAFGPPRLC